MRLFDENTNSFIEPTDQSSAKYWCEKYHYSGTIPSCTNCYACYENDRQIGVICYGVGATSGYATSIGVDVALELVRVAMKEHDTPVTRFIAMSLKELKRNRPDVDAVISFADTKQGHTGTIYRAGNWVYAGHANTQYIRVLGELVHSKTLHSRYGVGGQSIPWLRKNVDESAERVDMPPKHRYVMPLTKVAKRQVNKLKIEWPATK